MTKSIRNLSKFCPKCATKFYLNPAPCVGGMIIKNRKVLLSRRKNKPFQGYWDIPGGFINPDETPQEALKREFKEELGISKIKVKGIVDFFSDAYGERGTPTLNIYYYAVIKKGEPKALKEINKVKRFSLNKLPKKIAFKNTKRALEKVQGLHNTI